MNKREALDCGSGCRGFDPRHSPLNTAEIPGVDHPQVAPGAANRAGYSSDSVQRMPRLAEAESLLVPRGRWAEQDHRVYFIECNFELVKIGWSSDPHARLEGLRTSNPYPLELLALVDAGRDLEQALHVELADYRVTGEWFRKRGALRSFLTGDAVRVAYWTPGRHKAKRHKLFAHIQAEGERNRLGDFDPPRRAS